MKAIKSLFATGIIVSLTLFSCQKDDPQVIVLPSNPNPTQTSAIGDFFKNNLEDATQDFGVNPNSNSITGEKGTVITFSSNTFTYANGNAVVGNFTIELIEAQHKRDMLLLNKQTVTKDGQLLVSGGIVYVNAHQNGQQLSINDSNPIQATIPSYEWIQMDYFIGGDDANGDFGWDLSNDDTVTTITTNVDTTWGAWYMFDFEIDSIGWINCDYFYSSEDPLTDVEIDLPEEYNGSNTMVFVYYSGINSVANMNDSDEDGIFNLGYSYETPIGMNVSFIVVSEIDGSYYYAIVAATITDNHLEIIDSSAINGPSTEEDIQDFINAL